MSELYLIGGHASCLPVFWEAVASGEHYCQMGGDGQIAMHYEELPSGLSYFGLRCVRGAWGIVPQEGELGEAPLGAETIPVSLMTGPAFYRRQVLWDSLTGSQQTTMSEIGVGPWRLQVHLIPNFCVSFYRSDDEILQERHQKTGDGRGAL